MSRQWKAGAFHLLVTSTLLQPCCGDLVLGFTIHVNFPFPSVAVRLLSSEIFHEASSEVFRIDLFCDSGKEQTATFWGRNLLEKISCPATRTWRRNVRCFVATLLVVSLVITVASSQVQQKPLSNDDVIKMVSLGLADKVIIEEIRAATTTTFDTSIDGLKALNAAKVSDAVLQAMINPHGSPTGTNLGKTADQGNGVAENNLGVMYERGHDYQQALVWYRKAADQGQAAGQYNLGWMYAHGLGVVQDYQQALVWYRKAADQGSADAENNLGMLHKDGRGVQQDDRQAVVWFRKAADQGYASAELNLGWMYEHGQGVTQDYQQALVWYRKAADQGNANAQSLLDALLATEVKEPSTATSAQTDECTNPHTIACRERAASTLQSSLRAKYPDMRVRAFGDVIVLASPALFEGNNRSVLQKGMSEADVEMPLCTFGFKKIRLAWSEDATAESGQGEDFDVHCSHTEEPTASNAKENKLFKSWGISPPTSSSQTTSNEIPVANLEAVRKAESAARYVSQVRNMMRDPDSFVLERVTTRSNKNGYSNVCVYFRSKNGFGGYESGIYAFVDSKKGVQRLDVASDYYFFGHLTHNLAYQRECESNKHFEQIDITQMVENQLEK